MAHSDILCLHALWVSLSSSPNNSVIKPSQMLLYRLKAVMSLAFLVKGGNLRSTGSIGFCSDISMNRDSRRWQSTSMIFGATPRISLS